MKLFFALESKSFKWFVTIIAEPMIRSDYLELTSIIRDLTLMPSLYPSLEHFFRAATFFGRSLFVLNRLRRRPLHGTPVHIQYFFETCWPLFREAKLFCLYTHDLFPYPKRIQRNLFSGHHYLSENFDFKLLNSKKHDDYKYRFKFIELAIKMHKFIVFAFFPSISIFI